MESAIDWSPGGSCIAHETVARFAARTKELLKRPDRCVQRLNPLA